MESLVMHVVVKELQDLNVTYTIVEQDNGSKRLNLKFQDNKLEKDHFMRCYNQIRDKLSNHRQYDGWDLTCVGDPNGPIEDMHFLNEGSLFFDNEARTKYEFILHLQSFEG